MRRRASRSALTSQGKTLQLAMASEFGVEATRRPPPGSPPPYLCFTGLAAQFGPNDFRCHDRSVDAMPMHLGRRELLKGAAVMFGSGIIPNGEPLARNE